MKKVGVCGHFGNSKNCLNGQTIKTKIVTNELINILGESDVYTLDTFNWKKNPIKLLIKCFSLFKKCKNIIMLPAHNGVKVFSRLFLLINMFFRRKLHYIVIGGWLPEYLKSNPKTAKRLMKFDGIYVEVLSMKKALDAVGFTNTFVMPNCKKLDILAESELCFYREPPYKLCTFSRVCREKGIEVAVEAVKNINSKLGKTLYSLDIFGQIDSDYIARFEELKVDFPDYITYAGSVPFDCSVATLKNYFALLFPTFYSGEGFAGTLLDAFAAGLPVVASDWKYNSEIVDETTGIIYPCERFETLEEVLEYIAYKPDKLSLLKMNCIKQASCYLPEKVVGDFCESLG